MEWDDGALALIQAAPLAVQPTIRRRIEALAAEQGVDHVSREFLNAAMARRHGVAMRPTGHGPSPAAEPDVAPLMAREGVDPLTSAFEAAGDVHVFAPGKALPPKETAAAWGRAEQTETPSERPCCLYIHIPFCRSRCFFCPFYANRWTPGTGGEYTDALIREIDRLATTPLGASRLDAVYFGGGTPSDLSPYDLKRLLRTIQGQLSLAHDAEVTLEGRVWQQGPDLVAAALAGGVNRFSIGVQSFDTRLRRSVGRKDRREEVLSFLEDLTESPAAVVIDLIFGLPGQTMAQWRDDLRNLHEETRVHGVDLYRLKAVPGSVMEDMIADGRLPCRADLAESAGMFAAGVEAMETLGWDRLSIPHWRRDRRERSRYNLLVKAGADCIPIGCGAGGRIGRTRFFQTTDLATYLSEVADGRKPIASAVRLGGECEAVDRIAHQIEHGRIDASSWAPAGGPLAAACRRLLDQWAQAGLLIPNGHTAYELTVAGQFWSVQMGTRLARLVSEKWAAIGFADVAG
jgi:oxygen-independent coproporphyrinogen-3 oxidase